MICGKYVLNIAIIILLAMDKEILKCTQFCFLLNQNLKKYSNICLLNKLNTEVKTNGKKEESYTSKCSFLLKLSLNYLKISPSAVLQSLVMRLSCSRHCDDDK